MRSFPHKFTHSFFGVVFIGLFAVIFLLAGTAHAATGNLAENPSFEVAGVDSSRAYFWHDFHDGYRRAPSAHTGSWGIQVNSPNTSSLAGAYHRVDLNQTELKPVVISGYVRGSRIRNNSYFGATLYAEIHMQDGTIAYWNSVGNFGTFDWRWIGFNTGRIPWVDKPISHIFVVPLIGYTSGTAYFDDISVVEHEPSHSGVTIMFDDGDIDTYSVAKPIMDTHGMVGVSAMVTEMIDEEGFLSADQLVRMEGDGWEIVSHSVTHDDMTTFRRRKLRSDLANSKKELEALGLTVRNFAMPYGAYNAEVLAEGHKHYRSMRAFEQGSNPEGVYPLDMKVRGVVETTTAADVAAWLDDAKLRNRWVVLVFHTVRNEGDDAYHTRPDVFEDMMQMVADSGVPVMTYDEALDLFNAPTP